jgi:hypothetical protein
MIRQAADVVAVCLLTCHCNIELAVPRFKRLIAVLHTCFRSNYLLRNQPPGVGLKKLPTPKYIRTHARGAYKLIIFF